MNSRAIQQMTNDRIYSRNIPAVPMDNPLSFRPVITKYTKEVLPLPTVEKDNTNNFSVNTTFTPGDRKSPWAGYKKSVDVESILRDQTTYIGKDRKYVPNVLGDMYIDPVYSQSNNIEAYPYLFKQPEFGPFNPGKGIKAPLTFYNSSRLGR